MSKRSWTACKHVLRPYGVITTRPTLIVIIVTTRLRDAYISGRSYLNSILTKENLLRRKADDDDDDDRHGHHHRHYHDHHSVIVMFTSITIVTHHLFIVIITTIDIATTSTITQTVSATQCPTQRAMPLAACTTAPAGYCRSFRYGLKSM